MMDKEIWPFGLKVNEGLTNPISGINRLADKKMSQPINFFRIERWVYKKDVAVNLLFKVSSIKIMAKILSIRWEADVEESKWSKRKWWKQKPDCLG